jgi:hypothetical protein
MTKEELEDLLKNIRQKLQDGRPHHSYAVSIADHLLNDVLHWHEEKIKASAEFRRLYAKRLDNYAEFEKVREHLTEMTKKLETSRQTLIIAMTS